MPWEQPAHLVPNLLEKGKKKRELEAPAVMGCGGGGGAAPLYRFSPSPPQNPTAGALSSSISRWEIWGSRRFAPPLPFCGEEEEEEEGSLHPRRRGVGCGKKLGFGMSPPRGGDGDTQT